MKLHTSSKVAVGYIILICFLIGATYYIFEQTSYLTQTPDTELSLSERRKTTHRIITLLYEAENIGQTIRMGHWQAYDKYSSTMKQAKDSIDALYELFGDSLQKARLDTLKLLLDDKERNMKQLLIIMDNNRQEIDIKKKINNLISKKDSIVTEKPKLERKVIEKQKTYKVEKKNKKFFQRLADAFRPAKEDTTHVQQSTYVISLDTITYADKSADTITQMINGLENQREISRNQKKKQIDLQEKKLRYAGIQLTDKVSQLLEDIEKDEQIWIKEKREYENILRKQTIVNIGAIAVIAILLAIIFFTIIWRDISKSNMYRKELEKAKEKAEALLYSREKLMLTITHDIKAPVGSILGYLELISPFVNDKKPLFYLNNIRSSASHLLALVSSLLDYHRLEANKLDLKEVSFNAFQLMESICNGFKPQADKKGLKLIFNGEENAFRKCFGDAFRIRQITENLISNAIKFTAKGEVSVNVKLTFGQMHISIKDTGCGMTEEEKQQIFKAFTRLKSAQGEEGFGLGLSITKKLVELLNGEINIESTKGKGTCFYVRLPVKTNRLPEKKDNISNVDYKELADNLNIILIDDDPIQLELNKALIIQLASEYDRKNWNITLCRFPEEVMEHIRNSRYDILLTDIQMPSMNGFELIEKVKNITKELPVIAITARNDMEESDFINNDFAALLKKPFNISELKRAISKACNNDRNNEYTNNTDVTVKHEDENSSYIKKNDRKCNECNDINIEGLTVFAADDREASMNIICTFINETEKNLIEFSLAAKNRDIAKAAAIAHKILPNFQIVNAGCIEELRIMENRRNSCEWMNEYEKECTDIIENIKKVIEAAKDFADRQNIENGQNG